MSETTPEKTTDSKVTKMTFTEEEPIVRSHEIKLKGRTLKYTSECGRIPLKNEFGEILAQMFYIAYRLETKSSAAQRPLLFSFNGGPGSPSVWLHLGTIGPKRIPMKDGGDLPKPPYELTPNDATWLDDADVVFIDPIGTGYSQAVDTSTAERYWEMKGDIESISDFIRIFIGRQNRFGSPIFIVGESYGTTRAAGIANNLVRRGIGLNGIILVSSVLNFQTLRDHRGNDLPATLYLPSFAATAWYHQKINRKKHPKLREFLREVEDFALGDYTLAMVRGDQVPAKERKELATKLSEYLGVSEEFILENKLRIDIMRFCKELRRQDGLTVGRLDSRIIGNDLDLGKETFEHDPSMSALMPPYTMALGNYLRTELDYVSDLEYEIFKGIKKPWVWNMPEFGTPDTSVDLAEAMVRNPYMKVYIASGFFDLATPYFATEFTLSHMHLPENIRKNISIGEYEAGHMMYTHEESLVKLKENVSKFIEKSK